VRARVLFLLAALAAGAACGSSASVLVRLDMPGVSPFPPGSFGEIVVTDFRNEAPLADLDAGHELQAYLAAELRRAFSGTVSLLPLPSADKAMPPLWREAAAGRDRAVFITGTVRLTSQVRKAMQKKRVPVDSPFDLSGRVFIEQLRWTLAVELTVISGESGEPLLTRSFRENRDYIDLDKPADFAFSDLSAAVRGRLFPWLLGTATSEQRTLLRRSASVF
jgi:hypothetical protein